LDAGADSPLLQCQVDERHRAVAGPVADEFGEGDLAVPRGPGDHQARTRAEPRQSVAHLAFEPVGTVEQVAVSRRRGQPRTTARKAVKPDPGGVYPFPGS